MILNARSVYRALRSRDHEELTVLQDQLERSGYEVRGKGSIGKLFENHGFFMGDFGLAAVRKNPDSVDHEYFIAGERDGIFSKEIDFIKGRYKEDQFTSCAIKHIENNPGYITRFMVRSGWPAVFASSAITGFVSANHWNSNLAGLAVAGVVAAGAAVLTIAVKEAVQYYLSNWEGIYYGHDAIESVVSETRNSFSPEVSH